MYRTTTLKTSLAVLLALGLAVFFSTQAGNLEPPPGAPAPTMFTLSQLFNGIVVKTGQTASYFTGDDGDREAGVNVVGSRFIAEDGKVIDRATLLVWLQDANCDSVQTWNNALLFANSLSGANTACFPVLNDGSAAGAWRLPNINELSSLTNYSINGLVFGSAEFENRQTGWYWTSTTAAQNTANAWMILGSNADHEAVGKGASNHAWAVRDYDPQLDGPL